MEARYKRELNHNYLIIAMDEEDSNYQLKMLLNNQIEGLLEIWMKQVDGKREFYYEISSKQPLSRLLERKRLSAAEVRELILSLTAVLKRVEEYLLPAKQLVLSADYIYVEPETFQFYYCCLPGYEDGGAAAVAELVKYMLDRVDYQEAEAVSLIYRLYQEAAKENFKMETLAGLLYKPDRAGRDKNGEESEDTHDAPRGGADEAACETAGQTAEGRQFQGKEDAEAAIGPGIKAKLLYHICLASSAVLALCALCWPYAVWKERMGAMLKANWFFVLSAELAIVAVFALLIRCIVLEWRQGCHDWEELWGTDGGDSRGAFDEEDEQEWTEESCEEEDGESWDDDGILQWIGETVVLSKAETQAAVRRLVPLEEGQTEAVIEQFPFVIGKSPELADLVLPYTAVSRMHARIDKNPDGYRVTDLNSTNGTRVGEQRLEANESAALMVGGELWIANVGFRFE